MTTLDVEVILHAPTVFEHCQHCEVVFHETGFSRPVRAEQLETGLPGDLQREYEAVHRWARRLTEAYGDRVTVKVIDATSPAGVWKSLRHRLHRYPAIVVNGRERFFGPDLGSVDSVIERHLGSRLRAAERASFRHLAGRGVS